MTFPTMNKIKKAIYLLTLGVCLLFVQGSGMGCCMAEDEIVIESEGDENTGSTGGRISFDTTSGKYDDWVSSYTGINEEFREQDGTGEPKISILDGDNEVTGDISVAVGTHKEFDIEVFNIEEQVTGFEVSVDEVFADSLSAAIYNTGYSWSLCISGYKEQEARVDLLITGASGILASKSIRVNVEPSKASLSLEDSSKYLNESDYSIVFDGTRQDDCTLYVKPENIDKGVLDYSVEGSSVTVSAASGGLGNRVRFKIKPAETFAAGETVITFILREEGSPEPLVKAQIHVTVANLFFTNESSGEKTSSMVLIKDRTSSAVRLHIVGLSGSVRISPEYDNTAVSLKRVRRGDAEKNTVPYTIKGLTPGKSSINFKIFKGAENTPVCEKVFTVYVFDPATDENINKISFPFSNAAASRILSDAEKENVYQTVFGDTAAARMLKSNELLLNGRCFGMASGAGLLSALKNDNSKLALDDVSILKNDMSLQMLIAVMQVAQASEYYDDVRKTHYSGSLVKLVDAVKDNGPVEISIYHEGRGHSLLGYGYSEAENKYNILVYDSNYPLIPCTLQLEGSGWSYDVEPGVTWTGDESSLTFGTLEEYKNLWDNIGGLKESTNIVIVNASSFKIQEALGPELAVCKNGEIEFKLTDIENHIKLLSYSQYLPGSDTAPYYILSMDEGVDEESYDGYFDFIKISEETNDFQVIMAGENTALLAKTSGDQIIAYNYNYKEDGLSDDVTQQIVLPQKSGTMFQVQFINKGADQWIDQWISGNIKKENANFIGIGCLETGELGNTVIGTIADATDGDYSYTSSKDYYSVSIDVTGNGSVFRVDSNNNETEIDGQNVSVAGGSDLTLRFEPDDGFEVSDVKVDGYDVGRHIKDYGFTFVDRDHKVEIEFAEMEESLSDPEDKKTAEKLTDQILALNPVESLTLADKDKVEAALKAYDNLTAAQKKLVSTETVKLLESARTKIRKLEDQQAADKVTKTINGLKAVKDLLISDKQTVSQARAEYSKLTADQKKLVTSATVEKLTKAEAQIKKLEQDKQAADKVTKTINGLKSVSDLRITDKQTVSQARAEYLKLTDDQKKLVTTATVGKLTKAEAQIAKLTVNKDEKYRIGKLKYQVTSVKNNGGGTVTLIGSSDKKLTKLTVKASVEINYQVFKVTAIKAKAFSKYKKLKTVTIGKNVKTIGKSAFSGCSKLTSIKIKSNVLKSVGKEAFKGTNAKAKINVPKKKLKAYKKLLKNKGQGKKVKITQ